MYALHAMSQGGGAVGGADDLRGAVAAVNMAERVLRGACAPARGAKRRRTDARGAVVLARVVRPRAEVLGGTV